MKRAIGALLLLATCSSCNLFKNTNTEISKDHESASKKSQLTLSEQKDWLSNSNETVFLKDSSNHNYEVQIWPKGLFSFSPEKGFNGEAGQVLIRGSTQESMETATTSKVEARDKGKVAVNLSQQQKIVADYNQKIKKSWPSWKWLLAGLVLIVAASWYLYRKLT